MGGCLVVSQIKPAMATIWKTNRDAAPNRKLPILLTPQISLWRRMEGGSGNALTLERWALAMPDRPQPDQNHSYHLAIRHSAGRSHSIVGLIGEGHNSDLAMGAPSTRAPIQIILTPY